MSEEHVQYKGLHGLGTTHTYIDHGPMARVTNRTHKVLPWHIIVDVLKRNPDALAEDDGAQLNLVIKAVGESEFLMLARSTSSDLSNQLSQVSTAYRTLSIGGVSSFSPPPLTRSASGFSEISTISSISEAISPCAPRSSTPLPEEFSPPPLRRMNSDMRTLTLNGHGEEKESRLSSGMSGIREAWRRRGTSETRLLRGGMEGGD